MGETLWTLVLGCYCGEDLKRKLTSKVLHPSPFAKARGVHLHVPHRCISTVLSKPINNTPPPPPPQPLKNSQLEEPTFSLIHIKVFIVPAMAGVALLSHLSKTTLHNFVAWLYGIGLVCLFTISSMFHAVCLSNKF
jgi:hypothetical protein